MVSGMIETKLTFDDAVALIRYRPDANSLAPAHDLWQGLQGISSYTQSLNNGESISWRDTGQSHHSIKVFLKGER
jgi:hypothetical protein